MTRWAFLWITDLHFADADSNYTDDPKELNKIRDEPYRTNVLRDFHTLLDYDYREFVRNGVHDPLTFIAVGGDITTRGNPDGFKVFSERTFSKLNRLVSAPEAICIVPGNHDVTWGLNPTSPNYFGEKFRLYADTLRNKNVTTCLIPKGELSADQSDNGARLEFDTLGSSPIYIKEKKRVLVLTINSSIRCAEMNLDMASDLYPMASGHPPKKKETIVLTDFPLQFRHYLIRDIAQITQPQRLRLGAELEEKRRAIGDEWNSYLRVAVVHHHLATYSDQEVEHKGYEATLDSPALLRFLIDNDFDLVLCGHKHHPYVLPHRSDKDKKEILLFGGATVGGWAANQNSRGFQFVEVTANYRGKRFFLRDVRHELAGGDIQRRLNDAEPDKIPLQLSRDAALYAPAKRKGYLYHDIVSMTRIRNDGDAHRMVECDGLVISRTCERCTSHPIELPPTSGYLALLRASSEQRDLGVGVRDPIPEHCKSANAVLEFDRELRCSDRFPDDDGYKYKYEWFAVNAFAMDKLQFFRKYGKKVPGYQNAEFTHFVPDDPIERLTVMVQFPEGLRLPYEPHIRIMRPHQDDKGSCTWTVDADERDHLLAEKALRYFEGLNLVALRVRIPKPGLSYGIQWTLPDAPEPSDSSLVSDITDRMTVKPEDTLRRIFRLLEYSRDATFSKWAGVLDGTLMLFKIEDSGGLLKTVAAGYSSGPSANGGSLEKVRTENEITLEYGEGIAGRAFKANAIRIYRDPSIAGREIPHAGRERYEPNFYKFIQGTIRHRGLIAFPVHLPVEQADFDRDPNVYKMREPYGVLSIGSESPGFLNYLVVTEERALGLPRMQHTINQKLAESAP